MVRDYSHAATKEGGFIYLPQSNDPNYLNIETKTVFHKEAGTVDLIHEVREGKRFIVNQIRIRGNSRIQDKVFIRELRVAPGDPYNSSEFLDAVDRMRATNLVTGAQITPIG